MAITITPVNNVWHVTDTDAGITYVCVTHSNALDLRQALLNEQTNNTDAEAYEGGIDYTKE